MYPPKPLQKPRFTLLNCTRGALHDLAVAAVNAGGETLVTRFRERVGQRTSLDGWSGKKNYHPIPPSIWVFPKMVGFPPKSSIWKIGFSMIFTIHFGGPALCLETPIFAYIYIYIHDGWIFFPWDMKTNTGLENSHGVNVIPAWDTCEKDLFGVNFVYHPWDERYKIICIYNIYSRSPGCEYANQKTWGSVCWLVWFLLGARHVWTWVVLV